MNWRSCLLRLLGDPFSGSSYAVWWRRDPGNATDFSGRRDRTQRQDLRCVSDASQPTPRRPEFASVFDVLDRLAASTPRGMVPDEMSGRVDMPHETPRGVHGANRSHHRVTPPGLTEGATL